MVVPGAASPGDLLRRVGVKVRIPSPLRSYTGDESVVDADGSTVSELLDDLDRRYPGIRFRMVDEQNQVRQHMKLWIGDEPVRDLSTPVGRDDEVTIMQALSGG
jgi:molybdopterin synthase sulfur carrier subunit